MPFAGYENFEACVLDQTKKGHSEESARRICGKLQAEAEGENRSQKSQIRSQQMAEKDKDDSARMYLIVDENGEGHLKVRNSPDGPLDHGLMGAAHAALLSPRGFRGKKYEGPDKEKAIGKLKKLYAEAKLEWPEKEMGELDGKWIEVFRGGDYGDKGNYSRADLEAVARNYDADVHEAPICVGHPKTDAPAYGWVQELAVFAERAPVLMAKLRQVDPAFEALVKAGRFKKRSVAFYNDLGGRGLYLRHLGFLGAQPPEVKGLKSVFHDADSKGAVEVEFNAAQAAEEEDMEIGDIKKAFGEVLESLGLKKRDPDLTGAATVKTFSEAEVKAATEKAAADAKAAAEKEFAEKQKVAEAIALHKTKIREFIERLKPLGKWIPAFEKLGLVEFMEALPGEQTIEFGEAGKKEKKSAVEIFQKFLEGLPKIVQFGELPAPAGAGVANLGGPKFNPAAGIEMDPHSVKVAGRAEQIAAERKISFAEGLKVARRELGPTA